MPIRAVVLRGDFTDAEFAELVAVIRRFDHARPDAKFELVGIDPTKTALAVSEALLRDMVPDLPERTTEWLTLPTPRKWV